MCDKIISWIKKQSLWKRFACGDYRAERQGVGCQGQSCRRFSAFLKNTNILGTVKVQRCRGGQGISIGPSELHKLNLLSEKPGVLEGRADGHLCRRDGQKMIASPLHCYSLVICLHGRDEQAYLPGNH